MRITFCDLGKTPPSNSYLKSPVQKELFFPLHAFVCERCFLVQLAQFQSPDEIFSDYAYFSSYSTTWLEHARKYAEMIIARCKLNEESFVVEIASNDGYLLKNFQEKKIPLLGIEPAKNVAAVAIQKGIATRAQFFGAPLALELSREKKGDLIIANNVLAHVPDLNDFVKGLKILLSPKGTITLEFPHLLRLIEQRQFDTIYHEHFSYFSLISAEEVFQRHGLAVVDVEEIATHGGSLRVFLMHKEGKWEEGARVASLREAEIAAGFKSIEHYGTFSKKIEKIRSDLLAFLRGAKREGKKVAGYGAPAKGNTLLNFCQIRKELLPFTVDLNPNKQGCFLPGSHIPIDSPEKIWEYKPDYLLILPWNLKDEIKEQMRKIREWGGKFVVPIPQIGVE